MITFLLHAMFALTCGQQGMQIPSGVQEALSQPGFMDSLPKKAKPAPLDSDLPYIRCSVCEELTKNILNEAKRIVGIRGTKRTRKTRLESSSNLGGVEDGVEEMLISACNPEHPAGKWIRAIDVVKAGSALTLNPMPVGKCRRECRTIEKACTGVLDTLNADDLGETLLEAVRESSSASTLAKQLCHKTSKVCKKIPKWPEGKARKNEEFIALTKEDMEDENRKAAVSGKKTKDGNVMQSYSLGDIDLDEFRAKPDPRDELKDEL